MVGLRDGQKVGSWALPFCWAFSSSYIVLATALTKGGDPVGTACSRELWRILFGGAASLFALLLCLWHWKPSHLYWQTDGPSGADPAHAIASPPLVIAPVASGASTSSSSVDIDRPPHLSSPTSSSSHDPPRMNGPVHQFLLNAMIPHQTMAYIITTFYGALTMLEHCGNGRIVKRICPMGVWIGIDTDTYNTHSLAMTRVFRDQYLEEVPSLATAVPWPGSAVDCEQGGNRWICSHGLEPRNRMWKEAMVARGALGDAGEVEKWMGMVERRRPWWAAVLLVMQGVGYQVSVASRLAQGLEVSPVEMVSAWMSIFVVVEAAIIPLFAIPSKRDIRLRLDAAKFSEVANYYHTNEDMEALTFINLWCFVFCILYIFFMFVILIPPLVYYYRRLHHGSILSFTALIPFTILAGSGIVTFAFTLFLPPDEALLAFTNQTSRHIFGINLVFMLMGLASYTLAIVETSMHWARFQSADPSSFRFIIPHIGA